MTSFIASIENLFHSIFQIFSGLIQSVLAVGQSIFALITNLLQAVFGIVLALGTAVKDMMSGLIGFLLGEPTVCHVELNSDSCRQYIHYPRAWSCILVLGDADGAREEEDGRRAEESIKVVEMYTQSSPIQSCVVFETVVVIAKVGLFFDHWPSRNNGFCTQRITSLVQWTLPKNVQRPKRTSHLPIVQPNENKPTDALQLSLLSHILSISCPSALIHT